ncbi:dTDP-4-dehydrorhamnose 3,5-epimerase family protein [Leisingera sp. ANG-Vp]|uniref:dTDP-4-dehydrorhamnose 3,5-epimerase family protein n=1 Tax=Leisingera sp. ANG-Vp TaxID=1577896 RepID=UPI00057EEFC1|nr:dTDP-4-dehydrorhamnose 3,5-epimerase family protein [Leisingera sp. ANG-Vp]KIC21526.1 polysaccharide biosynthesis protein [Leisingera sp. ANG-Vp]
MQAPKPEEFVQDKPWTDSGEAAARVPEDLIEGVLVEPLVLRRDDRGALVELLTTRDAPEVTAPHVYQVFAEPGSVRAWVYHKWQSDRLCYTNGQLRLVLYDIREDSPTFGRLNVVDAGAQNPCRVTIPPYVVHGLANVGDTLASFVNIPTNFYDPANPDKSRLPYPDARIPYSFG